MDVIFLNQSKGFIGVVPTGNVIKLSFLEKKINLAKALRRKV
jgi:hypothetical protein